MSLRWIEHSGGRFVAVDGEYRLRIAPHGLVFLVAIFRGRSAGNSRDWELAASFPAASLGDAKRSANEQLVLMQDYGLYRAAAQGGL